MKKQIEGVSRSVSQKKRASSDAPNFFICNTPGMIRTCDLLIRSQALYPAELRVRESEYLDYKSWARVVKCLALN